MASFDTGWQPSNSSTGFRVPGFVKDLGREAWNFAKDNAVAIGTGVASYAGQQQTNAANARMAREQMEFQEKMAGRQEAFQERMSNTAVQRHVQDLKAAGLNPALAFSSSGASSPTGAMASGSMAQMENSVDRGINSAMAARMNREQSRLVRSQEVTERARAQQVNTEWLITQKSADDLVRKAAADANSAMQAARTQAALERMYEEQRKNLEQDRTLKSFELPRLQAEAEAWRNPLFRTLTPWLSTAGQAAGIVSTLSPRNVLRPRPQGQSTSTSEVLTPLEGGGYMRTGTRDVTPFTPGQP